MTTKEWAMVLAGEVNEKEISFSLLALSDEDWVDDRYRDPLRLLAARPTGLSPFPVNNQLWWLTGSYRMNRGGLPDWPVQPEEIHPMIFDRLPGGERWYNHRSYESKEEAWLALLEAVKNDLG